MDAAVARLFDAMADEYDLLEPWYEHLYARVHALVTAHLAPPRDGRRHRALDAGCGTGYQTARLQGLGYETHGIDISAGLLRAARCRLPTAGFARADLAALPYPDATFDAVSCAGSTLSFVAEPDQALAEVGRVLRRGGRLLLECEHKWSFDLVWALASALTGDALGYGVSVGALWRALSRPRSAAIALPYPGYGTLTLFTGRDLRRRLAAAGLRWEHAWGLHAATNIVPSTVLHRARLSPLLARTYRVLCALDAATAAWAPSRAIANSLVVLAVKT